MHTLQARRQQSGQFSQLENEAVQYTINWKAELGTDTVSTSTWTAQDGGAIANETSASNETSARLSAGAGRYRFTNKITTSTGATRERQIKLRVRNNAGDLNDYT